MRQILIRLTCNWCDDKTLVERFNKAYISELNQSNLIFTDFNNFDYLVIFNHPLTPDKFAGFPKERTIGIMGEPFWSAQRFYPYLTQRCQHILYHRELNNPNVIYYPGLLPMHFEGSQILDNYIQTEFPKPKKCSFVVSHCDVKLNNQTIYHERVNFAKQILESDLDIDIYGKGWQNSPLKDSRIKGELKNKQDGLMDYQFSIAIENSIEEDYFTEKLTDCILTDTTPIYYGCPNIQRFFNNVYSLSNLQNLNELRDYLQKQSLVQKTNKQLLATKYNLYVALTKYIQKIPKGE